MTPIPIISVIIPTYNRAAYLAQAVRSVLGQTNADFEVLIVDDGSTDDTEQTAKRLDDSRIVYIRQENAGRSVARNQGVAEARGEYVAFLDDDDLFLPHKLSSQLAFLEARPEIGLVASGAQLIDEEGAVVGAWKHWEDQPELNLPNCLDSCPLMPSVVLIRRGELNHLDHWFDPAVEPAEDTDLFLRLLLSGCRIAWLTELVTAYRLHTGSSQGDGVRYSQAYQRLLDKLFARPDLPASIKTAEVSYRAKYHLTGALRCYASCQVEQAQQQFAQAIDLRPDLTADEFPSTLAKAIASLAESTWVADPATYIDTVFDHLPLTLDHIRRHRGEALGALYMSRVFRAYERGERLSWDWMRGVYHDPTWLRNRGVWSILARSFVGASKP